jgi:hypothetical protein
MAGEMLEQQEATLMSDSNKRDHRKFVLSEIRLVVNGLYKDIAKSALLGGDFVDTMTNKTMELLSSVKDEDGVRQVVDMLLALHRCVTPMVGFGYRYRLFERELRHFPVIANDAMHALYGLLPQQHPKTTQLWHYFWLLANDFDRSLSNVFVHLLATYISNTKYSVALHKPLSDWSGMDSISFSPPYVDVSGIMYNYSRLYYDVHAWLPTLLNGTDADAAAEMFSTQLLSLLSAEDGILSTAVWSTFNSAKKSSTDDGGDSQ